MQPDIMLSESKYTIRLIGGVEMQIKGSLDKKFLEFFNEDELQEIERMAWIFEGSCILINTEKYLFELSADMGEGVEIYYDNNSSNESEIIDKKLFFELLRESPRKEVECIIINV